MLETDIEKKRERVKSYIKKTCPIDDSIQNVHTPFSLCKKILLKVNDFLKLNDKNIKIVVLFNLEFVYVLTEEFKINSEHITFISDSEQRNIVATRLGVKVINNTKKIIDNIKKGENIMGKQVDLVIGNPPYQAPKNRKDPKSKKGSCGKRLWQFFMIRFLSLVKKGGYISLIHPPLWRKPENALFPEFKKRDLKYLEIHGIDDGMKIFKMATAFDWYILGNSQYSGTTTIKDIDGNVKTIDISNLDCIPSGDFETFEKLLAQEDDKKCEIIYDRTKYGTDKKWMSKIQNSQFKYPCIYMNTKEKGMQFWYSNTDENGHFNKKKVIISENGGYLGIYNDYKGEYGLTQFMFGIVISSEEEGEQISKALQSEKFKKIWNATRWMSNHREWRVFKLFRKDFWKEFV